MQCVHVGSHICKLGKEFRLFTGNSTQTKKSIITTNNKTYGMYGMFAKNISNVNESLPYTFTLHKTLQKAKILDLRICWLIE